MLVQAVSASALPGQVEVRVVGQVDEGGLRGSGFEKHLELVRGRQLEDDVHHQVSREAFLAVGGVVAQNQRVFVRIMVPDHLQYEILA